MRVFAKVESFKKNKVNQQSKFTITKKDMKKGIVMFFMILHNALRDLCIMYHSSMQVICLVQGWVGPKPDPKFGPWDMGFEWPDPARARFWMARTSLNPKKLHFQLKNWSKLGQNRPKSATQTGPWPKKPSLSPTWAKNHQPEPNPGQKKSGQIQPQSSSLNNYVSNAYISTTYVLCQQIHFLIFRDKSSFECIRYLSFFVI